MSGENDKTAQVFETPKTFTLIKLIKVGDREITEMELREPTAGEIETLQQDTDKGGATGAVIKLIAKQTKLAPTDVRALAARDFTAQQEYLLSFLDTAPGRKDSES